MDRTDQQAIVSLFGKLAIVERRSPPRDREAEDYIREQIARQAGAPYYMAQTIVVQEQALNAAQARIEELEAEVVSIQSASGSPFSGMSSSRPSRWSGSVPAVGRSASDAEQQPFPEAQAQRPGTGFLAGAVQTAMGVGGGFLLGNMIADLFGDKTQAAHPQADNGRAEEADVDDVGHDNSGFDDFEI
jgi:hypothetical protein